MSEAVDYNFEDCFVCKKSDYSRRLFCSLLILHAFWNFKEFPMLLAYLLLFF